MFLALLLLFQASTTTCTSYGSSITCQTHQEPRIEWELLQTRPLVIQPPPPQKPNQWYKRQPETLAQRVGKLVSSGDCDGALKLALEGGDFDLAEKAKAYCESKAD
jgi:hypothetical protein